MASTGFYNDNANRSYPFIRGEAFIPNSAIVDCGFIFGPGSGFTAGDSSIYLAAVRRLGDVFTFVFKTTALNLLDRELRFARGVDAAPYEIEYADLLDNQEGSQSESVSYSCNYVDALAGYLVTGPLDRLLEVLPADGELAGTANVEPALLRDASAAYARTVNLANGDRTRYETPDGCREQCWPDPPQPLWIVQRCVQGSLRFKEGYNLRISQDAGDNVIKFDAIVGAGEGEPCEQVPLFAGETPPTNSPHFEGGPACNQVIRSINGVGGRVVNVKGKQGVRVLPEPELNRITINVDLHNMAICVAEETLPSLSEVAASEDPCDCGPE
jgi:hypothetical protein